MSTDLILKSAANGASLDRESVSRSLAAISSASGLQCGLDEGALSVHIAEALPLTDSRCAGIQVSFKAGGRELVGTARRGGISLLYWCFHELAKQLQCQLFDPQAGERLNPDSQPFLEGAQALVAANESDILLQPPHAESDDEDESSKAAAASQLLVGFFESLVAAEQLSLTCEASELGHLAPQLKDPSELYETLLDSPLVDDVFLGESAFVRALTKFRRGR